VHEEQPRLDVGGGGGAVDGDLDGNGAHWSTMVVIAGAWLLVIVSDV
jgi:hypothetical protein